MGLETKGCLESQKSEALSLLHCLLGLFSRWKEEFEQKSQDISTNDGMIEYYTQSIEEEARRYAEERIEVYLYYMEH